MHTYIHTIGRQECWRKMWNNTFASKKGREAKYPALHAACRYCTPSIPHTNTNVRSTLYTYIHTYFIHTNISTLIYTCGSQQDSREIHMTGEQNSSLVNIWKYMWENIHPHLDIQRWTPAGLYPYIQTPLRWTYCSWKHSQSPVAGQSWTSPGALSDCNAVTTWIL